MVSQALEEWPFAVGADNFATCPGSLGYLAGTLRVQGQVALTVSPPLCWVTLQDRQLSIPGTAHKESSLKYLLLCRRLHFGFS